MDGRVEAILEEKILEWARRIGLNPVAIIVYGSASTREDPRDIDVAIFVPYDEELAKDSDRIQYYELDLKAEWDAYALEHRLPALDPLLVVGYRVIGDGEGVC